MTMFIEDIVPAFVLAQQEQQTIGYQQQPLCAPVSPEAMDLLSNAAIYQGVADATTGQLHTLAQMAADSFTQWAGDVEKIAKEDARAASIANPVGTIIVGDTSGGFGPDPNQAGG